MNILAISTSNNEQSINRALAAYTAQLAPNANVEVVDMREFEMPLYSDERELSLGTPAPAQTFYDKIAAADAIVISFAEHNGSYTAAYKNLFDWTSRINKAVFQHKPSVFLSTSPGASGAASVLASAVTSAGFFEADLVASVSVPNFYQNMNMETGTMQNTEIDSELNHAMHKLRNRVCRQKRERLQTT